MFYLVTIETKFSVKLIYFYFILFYFILFYFILFYFIIIMATCFNPRRSSLGLHFEPTFLKICVHSWDPKQCLQILSMNWFISNNLMEIKITLC